MKATERDFNSFYLGDNVYELADGSIPEIAERLDLPLSNEPNSGDMQTLVDKAGKNRVLRMNQEIEAIDRETKADLLERSGIQKELRRSLWTPDVAAKPENLDAIVGIGGVANWQDRTAGAITDFGAKTVPVYLGAGTRLMNTATELPNKNVSRISTNFKRQPTEAEYVASVVSPRLKRMGHVVLATPFETEDGDEILRRIFEMNQHLANERVAMARVANAGIIMAIQMREAARQIDPDFDNDPKNPQAFVITDTFPIARTKRQDNAPKSYQKTDTAMRQLVLTAKKLHEAAGGE